MNHTLLTADAFLAILAVVMNTAFAALILFRTAKTTVYRTFFLICTATIIWNLGDFMVYVTARQGWFYFSLIGTAMLPALMFHFISALVKPQQERHPLLIPFYLYSGFLALSSPLAMVNTEIRRFVDGFVWNVCYLALFIPVFLWSIVRLRKSMRQAAEDEKERLRYVFIAVVIGVLTGLTDLVQMLEISVPPLGHLGTVAYSTVLAIGVFKHRAAYDILAQIEMRMKLLSETAAGIAHEIRNPLSSIKGATELAAAELNEGSISKGREYLDIITEEVERLNGILADFQHFTKPLKIDKKPVSINEVIQKTIKLWEMGRARINIRKNLSDDLPVVQADASLLRQAFINLIKNSEEACGTNGDMTLHTEYITPHVVITFCDNGPGMPSEVLKHVFEPFFTTKASGTGMGMAICQRIINAHQGRIEAENISPNGMRFSIFLPVKE